MIGAWGVGDVRLAESAQPAAGVLIQVTSTARGAGSSPRRHLAVTTGESPDLSLRIRTVADTQSVQPQQPCGGDPILAAADADAG